jgi:hypothetical protein
MNARKVTMMAAVLSLGLFTLEESALALHDHGRKPEGPPHCKQVKAQSFEVSTDPATATGTISRGGVLNGTTLAAFVLDCPGCINGALFTPDPTTVSFTGHYTLTTNHGELKAYNVYLYNFSGVGTVLGRINPATSTGRFAGATGVLYFAVKVTSFSPFTLQAEMTGEICFATANKARDWDDWRY